MPSIVPGLPRPSPPASSAEGDSANWANGLIGYIDGGSCVGVAMTGEPLEGSSVAAACVLTGFGSIALPLNIGLILPPAGKRILVSNAVLSCDDANGGRERPDEHPDSFVDNSRLLSRSCDGRRFGVRGCRPMLSWSADST